MTAAPLAEQVIAHHLALFGLPVRAERRTGTGGLHLVSRPSGDEVAALTRLAERGAVVAALTPQADFLAAVGVATAGERMFGAEDLRAPAGTGKSWGRLTSLHPVALFAHDRGEALLAGPDGQAAWLWLPIGKGGLMLVGSDMAADLTRFRQGDPAKALDRPTTELWGVGGERPVYLFEDQLAGLPPSARPADDWAFALASALSSKLGAALEPLLPGGAPGAVVITGDDDMAYLEKYADQLATLDGLPITYFLHPQTRHTPETLESMLGRPGIEIEIHPDALDHPDAYGPTLDAQCAWFSQLVGRGPTLTRNHGFLNDGYWGHAPHWLRNGILGSSNLPGFDGRVLNGSLLPARLAYDGELTPHWSLLTAVGDGVRFAAGYTDQQAADKVLDVGRRIVDSGIPGVLALNLHPQNIDETRTMHQAVRTLVDQGFQAWNLGQCLEWFKHRDDRLTGRLQPRRLRLAELMGFSGPAPRGLSLALHP